MKKFSLVSFVVLLTLSPFIWSFIKSDTGATAEIEIGNQIWMSRNLNVDEFNNGTKIIEAKSIQEWEQALEEFEPAWCYYNFDSKYGDEYGKLYNYWAVSSYVSLAPKGWRIPEDEDWKELIEYLGKDGGKKLKSIEHWNKTGKDTYGFSGLPGGYLSFSFKDVGLSAHWWSSTEEGDELSHGVWTYEIMHDKDNIERRYSSIDDGFSIRCIKINK